MLLALPYIQICAPWILSHLQGTSIILFFCVCLPFLSHSPIPTDYSLFFSSDWVLQSLMRKYRQPWRGFEPTHTLHYAHQKTTTQWPCCSACLWGRLVKYHPHFFYLFCYFGFTSLSRFFLSHPLSLAYSYPPPSVSSPCFLLLPISIYAFSPLSLVYPFTLPYPIDASHHVPYTVRRDGNEYNEGCLFSSIFALLVVSEVKWARHVCSSMQIIWPVEMVSEGGSLADGEDGEGGREGVYL